MGDAIRKQLDDYGRADIFWNKMVLAGAQRIPFS